MLFYRFHLRISFKSKVHSVNLEVGNCLQRKARIDKLAPINHLQFNVLGRIKQLEKIIVGSFDCVVVDKRRHRNQVLRQALEARCLDKQIMLSQHVVNVDFLNKEG